MDLVHQPTPAISKIATKKTSKPSGPQKSPTKAGRHHHELGGQEADAGSLVPMSSSYYSYYSTGGTGPVTGSASSSDGASSALSSSSDYSGKPPRSVGCAGQ